MIAVPAEHVEMMLSLMYVLDAQTDEEHFWGRQLENDLVLLTCLDNLLIVQFSYLVKIHVLT